MNSNCMVCDGEEISTKSDGTQRLYKTPNFFICSRCTQKLLSATPEQAAKMNAKIEAKVEEAKKKLKKGK